MRVNMLGAFAVVLTLAACAAPVKDYQRLSEAGLALTEATDSLLDATIAAAVDHSSWVLLRTDCDPSRDGADCGTSAKREQARADLTDKDRINGETVAAIGKIRGHTALLHAYFVALNELATADETKAAEEEAKGVAKQLADLEDHLPVRFSADRQAGIGAFAKLAVAWQQRAALRRELKTNGPLILAHLGVAERVATLLSDELRHDLIEMRKIRKEIRVAAPLAAERRISADAMDGWVAARRDLLIGEADLDAIEAMKSATVALRDAFKKVVEGKTSFSSLKRLSRDLKAAKKVADKLRK